MKWQPTAKLYGYSCLVVLAMGAALASGRPEPFVLAVPFALALAAGLGGVRALSLDVVAEAGPPVLSEGGTLRVAVTVTSATGVPSLECHLAPGPAFSPTGVIGPAGQALVAGQPATFCFELTAAQWGNQEVGRVNLRARGPVGLLESEGAFPVHGLVTVYPSPMALRRLVRSRRTTLASGAQLGAVKASGTELAGVRPYASGDRARDVNWRVSARHQGLYSNERHPDRSTDVVLALDTFDPSVLGQAVRVACALADAYLAQRDRLGVARFGGALSWLRPGMGMRQYYLVVDLLLSTSAMPTVVWKGLDLVPPRVLPPHALVICLSSLESQRSRAAMTDMRDRGLDVVVVEVPPVPPPLPELGDAGQAAVRLWRMQREMARDGLRSMGIPTAVWGEDRPAEQVLAELNAWSRHVARS